MHNELIAGNNNRQQPLLTGYLHKIHKRNGKREKYFVIFDDAPNKPGSGRLEYFDSEKKFKSAMLKSKTGGITNEKRSIILCTCFNINLRTDLKYRNVIGLYRKDDIFSIMAKDETECMNWLKHMLILQRGKESIDTDSPRPTYGEFNFYFIKIYTHKFCQVMPICVFSSCSKIFPRFSFIPAWLNFPHKRIYVGKKSILIGSKANFSFSQSTRTTNNRT
jgi:hypothetical protein